MSFPGFASYYRQNLKDFAIPAKSLLRICDHQTVFEMTQDRIKAYEKIRKDLLEAPLLHIPDWNRPFKLYIDACGDGLAEELHQVQIIDDKPTEGPKLHYYLDGSVFEGITDSNAMKSLPNMKNPNRNGLRWQIAIQEYSGNIPIVQKAGNIHKNTDGFSRWALANTPDSPACLPLEAEPQISIEGIKITHIGIELFEEVRESYKQDRNCHILTSLLDKGCKHTSLVNALDEGWKNSYSEGRFYFFDERSFPMKHGQQEGNKDKGESIHYQRYRRTAEPDRAHSDAFRITRSRPTQLSSGFISFRHQHISGQESSFFTIPGSFQEKTRIQGQKQDIFQPKAERVRPNDPETVGLGERRTKEPEIVVNASRISSPNNRNITPTQNEHSVATPESNSNSDALWLKISHFEEKTQKGFQNSKKAMRYESINILHGQNC
ncbi:hypothetical protein O181_045226 [Austropuccinia psidii MF-1]|uniref:Reverse transcriptase/retrotransposon-derived protein RNase H-like domain-containing protein n=1 Tax=Austropuccinia psidii MF-1 TaxID=1389203 RepID=A0A9Q3HHK2_9BASI|nr:hypothetical protein [Austropuccinia psidii MF-1]